ncbi:MAG: hypothetical protein ACL7BU_07080 [Candidatus Phlomobacter fragariae]
MGEVDLQHGHWAPFSLRKRLLSKFGVLHPPVIHLLRKSYFQLQPNQLPNFGHIPTWYRYLEAQYQRY